MDKSNLEKICRLMRYDILTSTTQAGTGHPTSSMSGVELGATLFFGGFFKYDPKNPHSISNDRFILSKGHASPLLYSLYHTAGWISEKELMSLRKFDSIFEGHPTPRVPWVDITTGSLGQGLSAGVGMALGQKLTMEHGTGNMEQKGNKKDVLRSKFYVLPKVYVFLGDSEMAEGQVWEAMEIASFYKLDNLIAIVDVNRLGQRGQTMEGWDLKTYQNRAEAFGWRTIVVTNGHDLEEVQKAYSSVILGTEGTPESKKQDPGQARMTNKPTMIIAKTDKGHGVSFLENKDDWHGKPVPKDKLPEALKELGEVDVNIRGVVQEPVEHGTWNMEQKGNKKDVLRSKFYVSYKLGDLVATREAYGKALVALGATNERIVAFDGEVSNSTYSDKFKKAYPERFFEMFIAEQNMVSAALGASKVGLIPFASTFAAFLSRAYDQIRMAQYSRPNLKLAGSHAGVSIGPDGPSQMALEDLAMLRAVNDSIVFYPSDGTSTAALVGVMADTDGLFYMRTTREKTPVLYTPQEKFKIGGSKVLRESKKDTAVVFTAGITLHEALKAHEELKKQGINIAVVDLYSVKPIDNITIQQYSSKLKNVIVVEDHYPAGGIGEAVSSVILSVSRHGGRPIGSKKDSIASLQNDINFTHLAVRSLPRSGTPEELLSYEKIDAAAIVKAVKK